MDQGTTQKTASQRGRSSRAKGQAGERQIARELADLLGLDVRRRVRNHAGESDLTGMPGWSIEVKHCATPSLRAWWQQTVEQSKPGEIPVLFFRLPRKPWRAVVHIATLTGSTLSSSLDFTVEMSLPAFAEVWREVESQRIVNAARVVTYAQAEKNAAVASGVPVQ